MESHTSSVNGESGDEYFTDHEREEEQQVVHDRVVGHQPDFKIQKPSIKVL